MSGVELWRYPVKSLLGEGVEAGTGGVIGDHQLVVIDAETGSSLTAKRQGNSDG